MADPSASVSTTPAGDQFNVSPFGATKTAQQFTQLSVDPSQGLTRKRYGWFSNESIFDTSLVADSEAGVKLTTDRADPDSEARIHSAYPGQYISQSVASPGLGVVVDDENVTDDGRALTHGEVFTGAFYWDPILKQVSTGTGFKWSADGWEFFVKSLGVHLGPSPVSYEDFNIDGEVGKDTIDISNGYIFNTPYTWYNEGPISGAYVNPASNKIEELVRVVVNGRPTFATPNLPIQMVVRNDGTADSLGVNLGGLQYTTYGAGRDELERRNTPVPRITPSDFVPAGVVTTNGVVDPSAEPGVPIVAYQRQDDRGDLNLRQAATKATPVGSDVWLFFWDEYDPATALDGVFDEPVVPNFEGRESAVLTNTTATTYTPEIATIRGVEKFEGGKNKEVDPSETKATSRIPIGATRVVTAIGDGGSATLNPVNVLIEEGF